jgi:hypothetical protein
MPAMGWSRHSKSLMALLFQLGLAALAAWGLWTALRPRSVFVVRIKGGVPRVVRGTVTRAFLLQIGETCKRHGVSRGSVRGVAKGQTIAIACAGSMPPACQQQLRNLWALSGWSAVPRVRRQ